MRVYINNFNLHIINDISDIFKEQLTNYETYVNVYTNEGIYHVEEKNMYLLDTCDKDIEIFENYYNNLTLIVDKSFYNKQISSCICGETHLSFQTKKYYYKLNSSSEMKLVIKYISDKGNFIPNDIYFEFNKDVDINNLFIKKEIIEFLSVLN
jgi:hypothetical protein